MLFWLSLDNSQVFAAPASSNVLESYFDFKIPKPITDINSTIVIDILFNLGSIEHARFKIRPVSENSLVKILKNDKETDVSSLWTAAPNLTDSLKIKLVGDYIHTNLWLEVLDTNTGKVYFTPKKRVWNGALLVKYLDALNQNISRW